MPKRTVEELDEARQAFLRRVPPTYQGVTCNYFLEVPRTMPVDDPAVVVEQVTRSVQDRIRQGLAYEREYPSRSATGLANLQTLSFAMKQDPVGALTLAEWAIAYVALPEDQRQARKTQQRQAWATESMRGKPATAKQLEYLKTLGHTGEVIDRRHASDLINNLTRSRP